MYSQSSFSSWHGENVDDNDDDGSEENPSPITNMSFESHYRGWAEDKSNLSDTYQKYHLSAFFEQPNKLEDLREALSLMTVTKAWGLLLKMSNLNAAELWAATGL